MDNQLLQNETAAKEQKERVAAYADILAGHASILSEKEYQHFVIERLSKDNGYVIRKAVNYDRLFAVDREMLFKFLNATQPDEMAALRKIYKDDLEDTIVGLINTEETKVRGSLLEVLKHGIEISNHKLELMLKSDILKTSAKNNSEKDFEFSYFDNIDDALIEGLDQNQDFFSLLLGNDEIKRQVLGIFAEEIYNSLRKV